jgi:hypothetical protein
MKKNDGVKPCLHEKIKIRRRKVITSLETQLKKNTKLSSISKKIEPLTEHDVKRINSELNILKQRI